MPLSPEREEEIRAVWMEPGASMASVRRKTRCGDEVARRLRPQSGPIKMPKITPSVAIPASALADMRRAAQEADEFEEPIAETWAREERRSRLAIRKAQVAAEFRWHAPGPHLLLTVLSDMHIAPGTPVDFEQMRRDAELIRDTPHCFAVLAGDQVDNHIKHRTAMLAARSQPNDQYKLFDYYLSILGHKCLIVTSGNHDDWTNQYAGVDVLGMIVRGKQVFYSPDEAWLDLTVGSQKYVVGVRHQYRFGSQFNQTHTVKQWLRLGPREFDVGVIGHHHEHALESTIYRGKFCWVARPGSYQITSQYSRQLGFNHAIPTCPTFLLHGDQHEITAWKSVRDMARSASAIKQLGAA